MGACASVNNTKANQIIAPLNVNERNTTENNEIIKPYLSYPYQVNVSSVEEMQRKYPDSDFVEYYLEKANQKKHRGRETYNLMTYEHPDISTIAPKELKEDILREIDSDSASITLILDKGITPNESIGKKGYGETILHYVAKHNNFKILKAILDWIKAKNPENLDTYLNIPDAEGNIPVMVAAICGAVECLYAFLNTKGRINVDKKNKAGLSLTDICKYFNPKSLAIVNRFNEEKLEEGAKRKEVLFKSRGATMIMNEIAKKFEQVTTKELEESKPAVVHEFPPRSEKSITSEDLKLTYQQTLDELSRTGAEFLDNEFYDKIVNEHNQTVQMKRDYLFLEKEKGAVKLLGNVSPYDILDGEYWTRMRTVIQALSCFPSVIKSAFNTKESNPQGLYSLTLYKNGIPQEVVTDNVFPINSETNKPIYFRTVGKKVWTNALGKGLAKLHGGYDHVANQTLSHLFANIIPIPVWCAEPWEQHRKDYMLEITDIADEILIDNLQRMISPDTVTYLCSNCFCKPITDGLKPLTLYQLLEIKNISNNCIVVGKNFSGYDEKMFKSLSLDLPVTRYNGFDEKAIESGVFPLRISQFKKLIERIYIIPKMLDGKYTYIPIEIENNHAEYFEIEITKEVTGWFKFENSNSDDSNPDETILIQNYETKPKVHCKFIHRYFINHFCFSELLRVRAINNQSELVKFRRN